MCGRYILVQKVDILEKRFQVEAGPSFTWEPHFNISPGQLAPVITSEHPDKLQLFRFGMVPFWAKKDMFLINARSEGDHNQDNNPSYTGARGIINKSAFRKPIRSQRCLIPADAFIEGSTEEKLNKPYLVYLRNKMRPFAFAGIFDRWEHPVTGEWIHSFAIITTTANSLLQKIPHHRSPVILLPNQEKKWLRSDLSLSDVTAMLQPLPGQMMNAYPIAPAIKQPGFQSPDLIHPIGERLEPETEIVHHSELQLSGMGSNKRFRFDPKKPQGT